jgi:hypothetical protein
LGETLAKLPLSREGASCELGTRQITTVRIVPE